ncbi:MAG: hypothetical protein Q7S43_04495 [bacterium]|nr:hypothetical protein [bacterium]
MELNQIQNPNISPVSPMPIKHKNYLFLAIILVIGVVSFMAWWYINQMKVVVPVTNQPEVNQEAREDAVLNNEIQQTDLGDLDAEFKSIDSDLNSL